MSRVPQNFSIFMETGTAKKINCWSPRVRQKGKEICCTVSRTSLLHSNFLLSAAFQQVSPLVIVAHSHPIRLKAVCSSFPEKMSVIYICTCNKTSGYNLMCMLFSPRTVVSSLGACILHSEEWARQRAIHFSWTLALNGARQNYGECPSHATENNEVLVRLWKCWH